MCIENQLNVQLGFCFKHSSYRWNNDNAKCTGMSLHGFISKKSNKNYHTKERKKSWEPFRICLLHSSVNPANFHPNWAGLAVLCSRQILNGSQEFSLLYYNFNLIFHIYYFVYSWSKRRWLSHWILTTNNSLVCLQTPQFHKFTAAYTELCYSIKHTFRGF